MSLKDGSVLAYNGYADALATGLEKMEAITKSTIGEGTIYIVSAGGGNTYQRIIGMHAKTLKITSYIKTNIPYSSYSLSTLSDIEFN